MLIWNEIEQLWYFVPPPGLWRSDILVAYYYGWNDYMTDAFIILYKLLKLLHLQRPFRINKSVCICKMLVLAAVLDQIIYMQGVFIATNNWGILAFVYLHPWKLILLFTTPDLLRLILQFTSSLYRIQTWSRFAAEMGIYITVCKNF